MMDFDHAVNVKVNGRDVERVKINDIVIWEKYAPSEIQLQSDKIQVYEGDTVNLTAAVYNKFGIGCPDKTVKFYAEYIVSENSNPESDNGIIPLAADMTDKIIECKVNNSSSYFKVTWAYNYTETHVESIESYMHYEINAGDIIKFVIADNNIKIYVNNELIGTIPYSEKVANFGINADEVSIDTITVKKNDLIGSKVTNSDGVANLSYVIPNNSDVHFEVKTNNLSDTIDITNLSDIIIWNPPLRGETGELILHSASETNGEVVGKGFLLKNGWENTGLWECSFEFRHDDIRYTGITYLANLGTTYNNSAKLTTWEGTFPNDSNYANYDSGTIDWFDITVTKIDDTHIRVKSETLNRDSGIIEVANLPNWNRLTIGAHHNNDSSFGPCRIRNVIVKKLPSSINVTSSKDILSYVDNDSTTLTAQLLDENNNPFKVKGLPVTFEVRKESDDSLVETLTAVTDSSGIASVVYFSKGEGNLSIKVTSGLLNKIYGTIEDYWKININTSDTWHNIQTSGNISVDNGIATGRNKIMDYGWDNNNNWELSFTFAELNEYGGFIITDTTNTSSYDKNAVKIVRNAGLTIEIYDSTQRTYNNKFTNSSPEYDYKIVKKDSMLLVYYKSSNSSEYIVIDTIETNPFATNSISCGLFTWVSTNGYFKNFKVKPL